MEAICPRYHVSLSSAALQFPLAHRAVPAVVIGAETPAEVRTNQAAFFTPLPPDLWDAFRQAGVLPEAALVPRHPLL